MHELVKWNAKRDKKSTCEIVTGIELWLDSKSGKKKKKEGCQLLLVPMP
jgi:hypothetical protein